MICIFGAIKEELSGVKQYLAIKRKSNSGSATFYEGRIKDKELLVVRTGVGQSPAQRAATEAVERFPLRCIISVGFAGGVVPELKIADLILAEKIYCCDNEESLFQFNKVPLTQIADLCNHEGPIKKILSENGTQFKTGNILSVDRVVGSVKLKKWLGENYPVLGVEMETASIVKIAMQKGLPFYSLRVVSDEVSHSIIQSNKFINKKGEISRLLAGYYALTHPFFIPRAIELKKNVSKASKTLTEALLKIINSNDI